ncbi:MAG: 2-hydroxyglutaryl-CoA dehydratase [Planctomycetes bacterium]|nr:2-hydroxyglutaryl-CoA dehydratase [Planctomycetota bacterium]
MIVAGIDVGSTATKGVLLHADGRILGRALVPTGANVVRAAERAFQEALRTAGIEDWEVCFIVGTGYGRYKVQFGHAQITEISCHAKGAQFLMPGTRTVLDIGGQDTKAIKVGEAGEVLDFCMNDKCAAGTGRFLEAAAGVLGLDLAEIGDVSLRSRDPLRVTNVCTVFVESEIVSHLAKGRKVEDILRGVHNAIAARSLALLRRVGYEPGLAFTGGVSRNRGMVRALEERLGSPVHASEDSPFMGAIGAALYARERAEHAAAPGKA